MKVVHRDLKPDNIFLLPRDVDGELRDAVKVLDFGISKIRGSETLVTHDAVIMGTYIQRSVRAFVVKTRARCKQCDLGGARAEIQHVTGPARARVLRGCKDNGIELK